MKLFKYIVDRAKERTTWLGLLSLGGAFGIAISPEQAEAITSSGMALAGLVLTFTKENKK